jgi:hypothetical protein
MTDKEKVEYLAENLAGLSPEFRDLAVQAIRRGIGNWDANGYHELGNFVHALACCNASPYIKEEVLCEAARLANVRAVMDS